MSQNHVFSSSTTSDFEIFKVFVLNLESNKINSMLDRIDFKKKQEF